MRHKIIRILISTAALLLAGSSHSIGDQAHDLFNTLLGTDYYGGLPDKISSGVLVQMLKIPTKKMEDKWAHGRVIEYILDHDKTVDWTDDLEKTIHQDKSSPITEIQIFWIDFTLAGKCGANKREILDLLNTGTEDTRKDIFFKIHAWPDRRSILESYVRNAKGEDANRGSVQTAKSILKAIST